MGTSGRSVTCWSGRAAGPLYELRSTSGTTLERHEARWNVPEHVGAGGLAAQHGTGLMPALTMSCCVTSRMAALLEHAGPRFSYEMCILVIVVYAVSASLRFHL